MKTLKQENIDNAYYEVKTLGKDPNKVLFYQDMPKLLK